MRKFLLACLPALLLSPAAAHAGDAAPGYVTGIVTVIDDHSILFTQDGARSNVPGCGSNNANRWAIDVSTPFGQAAFATMQTAAAQHKQVHITGTGDCSAHLDTEAVRYLWVTE